MADEECSAGIVVSGEVKAIYNIVEMGQEVQSDGVILIQAKTACGRTISVMKHPGDDPLYEVALSKVNSHYAERGYQGHEGSDAHRVYVGYSKAFLEKFGPLAEEESPDTVPEVIAVCDRGGFVVITADEDEN